MSKLKILFLAESLNVGGAEKALVSLLKRLDYSRYDIYLTLISGTGPFLPEVLEINNLKIRSVIKPVITSKTRTFLNALKAKTIYKWLPSKIVGNYLCNGYDVVIAFCEGYLTKWVAASSVSCRKIAWVHTDMVSNNWPLETKIFKNQEEERSAYSRFDAIIGVSEIVSNGMRNKYKCDNVTTVYNILDSHIHSKAKEIINLPEHKKLNLVSVGRLEYVKGYDILIDAMDILVNKDNLDVRLVLVGDGGYQDYLIEKIKSRCLDLYVLLTGAKTNPYPYIENSDVFVCTSRHEGFNIAVLEAMTLGKPIISTNCVGPAEILGNGKYGVLVEPNCESVASAIRQIYSDRELLKTYSKLSVIRISNFDASAQIKIIESIIEG